eukprot:491941_1
MYRKIVVIGATGSQGSAVILALLNDTKSPYVFDIIGLTRDPYSQKCLKLLQYKTISTHKLSFIKCDIHSKTELNSVLYNKNVWGIFCITNVCKTEVEDAKICIDVAFESNIKYFILSTTAALSSPLKPMLLNNKSTLAINKYEIEKYFKEKCDNFDGWVILRPTFFMDNFVKYGGLSNGYLTLPMNRNTKLQMTSAKDIGVVAAYHFINEIKRNDVYDIGFDELSPNQMVQTINKLCIENGKNPVSFYRGPLILRFLNIFPIHFVNEIMLFFKFIEKGGYNINVKKCRDDFPNALTFEAFCKKEFKNKDLISESFFRRIVKAGVILITLSCFVWYCRKKMKNHR